MENVIRVKTFNKAYRVSRTESGVWIEVLDPNAEPLSLDRWDLAELGLVLEEDAEVAERQMARRDPRLIELLSDFGGEEAPQEAETDSDSDIEAQEWLVNDTSLVDN